MRDFTELTKLGFTGEVYMSDAYREMYATDASIYRELPVAVVYPKNSRDMQVLVKLVNKQGLSIIPRGAGTSLAGQCVGEGVVMDVSAHMNQLISMDSHRGEVVVQPGMVRDELNRTLANTEWMFGPNTSTSNRATIGGMVGNNSSGTTSISYGVTRDKILALEIILSDESIHWIDSDGYTEAPSLSNSILADFNSFATELKSDELMHREIANNYPHPSLHRRNTGYALDTLIGGDANNFNLNKLICGSEGTLCLISKIKLKLDRKPPKKAVLVAAHFRNLDASLRHVPAVLKVPGVYALELIDEIIISCARQGNNQHKNMAFISGEPKALLLVEIRATTDEELAVVFDQIRTLSTADELYAQVVVPQEEIYRVWELRRAGLGVLSNIPGDKTPIACIEDTAVHPSDLADYIADFEVVMKAHGQQAVYYAHAGAGELHIRPILNLKSKEGRKIFRKICADSAKLIKKYSGSLSGEHGDGRVRAPFIQEFYGVKIYSKFLELKNLFDPDNIFNPGKIVFAKDLIDDLRYQLENNINPESQFNYSPDETILHHAERCNGSGDCRKSFALQPGMCPTYQATNQEIHTTRARANLTREALQKDHLEFPLSNAILNESMSSCLACKACKSECPSGVDVALLKSEYLFQRKSAGRWKYRDYLFAHPEVASKWIRRIPFLGKWMNSSLFKPIYSYLGIARERDIPVPARRTAMELIRNNTTSSSNEKSNIVLAIDEISNCYDVAVVLAVFELLVYLGYAVKPVTYTSGRALISKGYLKEAKELAEKNTRQFEGLLRDYNAIIGIEPSAILSFRDEYTKFGIPGGHEKLEQLNKHIYLMDEFLVDQLQKGLLNLEQYNFSKNIKIIHHVHCHQKVLGDENATLKLFNFIDGWSCEQINTGCCGMAGGFGYEAEHYELSQKVANLGLFPNLNERPEHFVVASGMSCRHQIRDGLRRKARHPAEFLLKMLLRDQSKN